MIAETVSVGTELLLGQIIDTNAAYLAGVLSQLGISVFFRTTVGDNAERIKSTLELAFSRADVVITIGGLGPTMDDLTKEMVCEVLKVPLAPDPVEEPKLRALAATRALNVPESFWKQALVPIHDGRAVPNPVGTAPGVWVEKGGKIAICLPGPPNELIPMVEQSVVPWLSERTGPHPMVIKSRVLRIIGIGEVKAEDLTKDLLLGDNPTIAPLAKLGECHLRITARAASKDEADALIAPAEAALRARLGSAVYGVDNDTLESVIVDLLKDQKKTLAVAESCTGGLVASRLTSISGASDVFHCGIVSYSNEIKHKILGVPADLIATYGAVSAQVAESMAENVRRIDDADFGVSLTGVAGPTGGTPEKPVGLVYMGLATRRGVTSQRQQYAGSRADVQRRSAHFALAWVREQLIV
jgi:nicotinamide-nucleotide amidase